MANEAKPIICVLNPDDIYRINNSNNNSEAIAGVAPYRQNCVSPLDTASLTKAGYEFSNGVMENTVFCIDPTNKNRYIKRTIESDENAISWRIQILEEILSLIGGKNYRITHDVRYKKENSLKVDSGIDMKYIGSEGTNSGNAGCNVDKADDSSIDKHYSGAATWPGSYSPENYTKACAIAVSTGLDQDPNIHSILQQRAPDHVNALTTKEYEYKIMSDLHKRVETIAKLSAGLGEALGISMNADVNQSEAMQNEESFRFEVEFCPIPVQEIKQVELNNKKRKTVYVVLGIILFLIAGFAAGFLFLNV